MKIYAIAVVKNEEDIIKYSLEEATCWADKVIVYDNGSTDGTWEKVCSLTSSIIVPFKQDSRPYSDGLRAEVFNAFKHEMNNGDWWVIQDADEFYEQSPREFIMNQKGYFHHINGKKVDFSFDLNHTDDLGLEGDFDKDREQFNFFTAEAWSEPRAIKHRENLTWNVDGIWPNSMGLVCEELINIRHYPLRSLGQIKRRWATRLLVKQQGGQSFAHWEKGQWEEYINVKKKKLNIIDDQSNVFDEVELMNNYKQGLVRRILKLMLHKGGLLP